jgi:hypothetical protein
MWVQEWGKELAHVPSQCNLTEDDFDQRVEFSEWFWFVVRLNPTFLDIFCGQMKLRSNLTAELIGITVFTEATQTHMKSYRRNEMFPVCLCWHLELRHRGSLLSLWYCNWRMIPWNVTWSWDMSSGMYCRVK